VYALKHLCVPAFVGLSIVACGWRTVEADRQPYVPLEQAEASRVTGGQTSCPTQNYSYTTGCPYKPGACNSAADGSCATPLGGGDYACNYDCTTPPNKALTSGGSQTSQGTINSTPCPSVPSDVCTTFLHTTYLGGGSYQTTKSCSCWASADYAYCQGDGGSYLALTSCAQ